MSSTRSAILLVACLAIGCSVINSFDDVVQGVDASSGAGGSGGGGATGGDAGTGASGGSSGQGGSSGDAGTSGTGGSGGGAGGTAGVDAGPTKDGLIVMFGNTVPPAAAKNLLITISPWTGAELSREESPTRFQAIAYEALRDKWFIFAQSPTSPQHPATLRAGSYNVTNGAFTKEGEVNVPAPLGAIAVLKDRIFYKSSAPGTGGGAPTTGVTVLDTAMLNQIKVVGQPQTPLPTGDFIGVIPFPNTSGVGGTVTLVQDIKAECALDDDGGTGLELCPIKFLSATVAVGDPTYQSPVVVGRLQRNGTGAGWVFNDNDRNNILVLPPKDHTVANPTGSVQTLQVFNHNLIPPAVPFDVRGPRISATSFDRCRKIVLATELNVARSIYAIPLRTGGRVATQGLANSGTSVIYEPFTKTVLSPFDDQTNPDLNAFVLEGSDTMPSFSTRGPMSTLPWPQPFLPGVTPKIVAVKNSPLAPCN